MDQARLFPESDASIGSVEQELRAQGLRTVIGVDEAGRGPLAGPVHAGAFWLDLQATLPACFQTLDDSKKIKEAEREELFEQLQLLDMPMAVGVADSAVVDEINILQATFQAMRAAVLEVIAEVGEEPDLILVDGKMIIPNLDSQQQAFVKGDGRSYAIAAASILAKVSRDRIMRAAAEKWPQYGFESNKGYGSKSHRLAIRRFGPTPIHRRSFAGVLPES